MIKLELHKFLTHPNLVVHRKDGLIGFDYSRDVTLSMLWDEISIHARGIVFEEATGKLIALPFPKFWNKHEIEGDDEYADKLRSILPSRYLPNYDGESMILEKSDGSCGIVFWYNDKWYLKTRGSFISDQAQWGEKFLVDNYNVDSMDKDLTHIFEIIYPTNRIVVDYGDKEALVLTGVIDPRTGKELWYDDLKRISDDIGCEIVDLYVFEHFEDVYKARDRLTVNKEGFVITFKNGYKFKLKGKAYCDIHRKISMLTPLEFWRNFDLVKFEISSNFMADIPEEFREEADRLCDAITNLHIDLLNEVKQYAKDVPSFDESDNPDKERYLFMASTIPNEYLHMALSLVKGQDYKLYDTIHHKVRPSNNTLKE